VTAEHQEEIMSNGAISNVVTRPATPAQIKVAGMAADLYGSPDGRPPLVLLSGLTYGRDIWQPVLGHLGQIDPGRQVLNLDLPGHGESPDQLPHTSERTVGRIHQAVAEAGLGPPVLAGHSQSGGFASVYAAQYPARGVINVEASPDVWNLVRVIQDLAAAHHGDVLAVWQKMEQTFGLDQLPAQTREFIMGQSRPTPELLASYWEDIFAMTPEQASDLVNGAFAAITRAGVPYLLLLGSGPSPDTAAWIRDATPHATVEVWAGSGHFPHVAHPARFAERLAATA
jgi:pimeloyl-ACP methyl ester carboxylesterase